MRGNSIPINGYQDFGVSMGGSKKWIVGVASLIDPYIFCFLLQMKCQTQVIIWRWILGFLYLDAGFDWEGESIKIANHYFCNFLRKHCCLLLHLYFYYFSLLPIIATQVPIISLILCKSLDKPTRYIREAAAAALSEFVRFRYTQNSYSQWYTLTSSSLFDYMNASFH